MIHQLRCEGTPVSQHHRTPAGHHDCEVESQHQSTFLWSLFLFFFSYCFWVSCPRKHDIDILYIWILPGSLCIWYLDLESPVEVFSRKYSADLNISSLGWKQSVIDNRFGSIDHRSPFMSGPFERLSHLEDKWSLIKSKNLTYGYIWNDAHKNIPVHIYTKCNFWYTLIYFEHLKLESRNYFVYLLQKLIQTNLQSPPSPSSPSLHMPVKARWEKSAFSSELILIGSILQMETYPAQQVFGCAMTSAIV